jgi:drug/metabolite transporter (DMT)-like permease
VIPVVWLFLGHRVSTLAILGAIVAFAGVCSLLIGG